MSNYATVEEAVSWLASEMGKNPMRDRAAVLEALNDARRVFYTLYQRVHLDFYIEGCVAVQEFCQPCVGCDNETYLGISLPPELNNVEALWTGCHPIPLYDKWVEYRTFIRSSKSCLAKGLDKGGDHPLQADIPCGQCAKLKFIATDPADCGKVVTVRFKDSNNEDALERLTLTTEGSCTEAMAASVARPGGIVLPVGLVGGVIVQDAVTGMALGRLHPKIVVPSMRRLKLTSACKGDHVAFRATRKFTEVYWDYDVIEVGGEQKLALIEAHRYNRMVGTGSGDPTWQAKAKMHLDNLTQYIAGSNMRSDGATVTRRIDLFGPAIKHRNGLFKNRR